MNFSPKSNLSHRRTPASAAFQPRLQFRPGFTLVEVLVAIVLTLVLLGLMIRAFALSSAEISKGRALLEISGQLRATTELLRRDLSGVTARVISRNQFGNGSGYFEYIEGIAIDKTVYLDRRSGLPDSSGMYGDVDDILMFTARSVDQPFKGRFFNTAIGEIQSIESNYAEIIWWTVFEDANGNGQFDSKEPLRLYRRVLLIRPDLATTATDLDEFLQFNDISVRQLSNGTIRTNSLSHLTDRANRFARSGTAFPHEPNYAQLQGSRLFTLRNPTTGNAVNLSEGEDIQLASLIGFDVQVFDPVVEMQASNGIAPVELVPSDNGYLTGNPVTGFGGYVDLNIDFVNGFNSNGIFSGAPNSPAPDAGTAWVNPVYCTWSSHYETDGVNQDGDMNIDEGSNLLDDDNSAGPDDVGENETQPPYPFPLRGIKITIRVAEPTTQIVRQTSVISNFVPE